MEDNSDDESTRAKIKCPFCGCSQLNWSRLSNRDIFALIAVNILKALKSGVFSKMENAFKKSITILPSAPALTSIIAVEAEFNRTVNDWHFSAFRVETRGFDQTSFGLITKTFTINVNVLPQVFYVDTGIFIAIIVSASIIVIAAYKRHQIQRLRRTTM